MHVRRVDPQAVDVIRLMSMHLPRHGAVSPQPVDPELGGGPWLLALTVDWVMFSYQEARPGGAG
jgi:hypothetical protein